jgi:hypothetical protein
MGVAEVELLEMVGQEAREVPLLGGDPKKKDGKQHGLITIRLDYAPPPGDAAPPEDPPQQAATAATVSSPAAGWAFSTRTTFSRGYDDKS